LTTVAVTNTVCLPNTSVVETQYHDTQALHRYVHDLLLLSISARQSKTARLQSDHAWSFSAAGLMTDNAIAAKTARTAASGMRPPTLLSSISLIARGLTRTLVRSGGRGFLDGRAERWRKKIAWQGRSDVFVPSTRLHDQPLLPFTTSCLGDLNGLSGIPRRGILCVVLFAIQPCPDSGREWTRLAFLRLPNAQSSGDIFSATGIYYH